ncbi:MAG TPA: helix-turn-helix transcriptional regulator [Kofleriaceae bacterium]|nr:helix-turn-helix transcriptional regulator [Kofleriaceae bacterium]
MDSRTAKNGATILDQTGSAGGSRGRGGAGESREEFCSSLRAARERAGLTIEEITRVTRIPEHQLRRLESGEFEGLPGDVFVRGFLRSYARCVRLDADDVVARYAACGGMAPAPVASDVARVAAEQAARLAERDDADLFRSGVRVEAENLARGTRPSGGGAAGGSGGSGGSAATGAATSSSTTGSSAKSGSAMSGSAMSRSGASGAATSGTAASGSTVVTGSVTSGSIASGSAATGSPKSSPAASTPAAIDSSAMAAGSSATQGAAGSTGAVTVKPASGPRGASGPEARTGKGGSRGNRRGRDGRRRGPTVVTPAVAARPGQARLPAGNKAERRRAEQSGPGPGAAARGGSPEASSAAERGSLPASVRAKRAPSSRDRAGGRWEGLRRGPVVLAVAVVALVIAAILVMSHLLRGPSRPAGAEPGAGGPAAGARSR